MKTVESVIEDLFNDLDDVKYVNAGNFFEHFDFEQWKKDKFLADTPTKEMQDAIDDDIKSITEDITLDVKDLKESIKSLYSKLYDQLLLERIGEMLRDD